jgi:hyperosmotically inducible protein
VFSEAGRRRALELARGTEGVREVVDKLHTPAADTGDSVESSAAATDPDARVRRRGEQEVSDSWLTAKVQSQLIGVDALEGSRIEVRTTDGVVTLEGTVRLPAGREKAASIARSVSGVRTVQNRLTVSASR